MIKSDKRHSHKNNRARTTARERAKDVLRQFGWAGKSESATTLRELFIIERALQAHAREALSRRAARERRGAR